MKKFIKPLLLIIKIKDDEIIATSGPVEKPGSVNEKQTGETPVDWGW